MVAQAMTWPVASFPRTSMFHPQVPSRSGGQSITGQEQLVVSAAGRWQARVEIPLYSENAVLSHRAMLAALQGRAGTVLVPKWEHYGPKDFNGRRLSQQGATVWGIGGEFEEDGLGFELFGWGQDDATAFAQMDGAADVGDTRITITLLNGEGPRPGQYFGIGQRLHLVSAIWQEDSGTTSTLDFWPPLREDVADNATVILDRPVCLMRLAGDDSGQLSLDYGRWGTASLDFVEVF